MKKITFEIRDIIVTLLLCELNIANNYKQHRRPVDFEGLYEKKLATLI